MIIGKYDDLSAPLVQLEFIIPHYSSPSGMFNFIIDEKLIPGEGIATDLYVVISFLKESLAVGLKNNVPDVTGVKLEDFDFSEGIPINLIPFDTGELYNYGFLFYLGFDCDEERFIYTLDFEQTFQEKRYPRGTIENLINSLPDAEQLEIIKKNKMIMLTNLKSE